MAEENTNAQEVVAVNVADTVNTDDAEQNTAQDVEDTQAVPQNDEQTPENPTPEDADEANTGTKVREYETPTLHEGVSRLGRLDQAYPDEEPEREDIQGYPDGPINKPPFFPLGASLFASDGTGRSLDAESLQVKEKGVVDGEEGGNTPLKGTKTVTGMVTAIDPEGGPLQYFLRDAGAQSQEVKLAYGTITLDRLTGEFEYNVRNLDKNTNGLNQGERVTETVQVYVMDEDGAEGSMPLTITVEGTNDKPVLTLPKGGAKLSVREGGSHMPDYPDRPPVVEDPILKDGDKLTVNDPDTDAKLSYAIAFKPDTKKATESDMDAAFDAMDDDSIKDGEVVFAGTYGRLVLDTDTGRYTYHLNPNKADPLRDWDKPTEEFTIYVRDEHGAWDSENITVNIKGGNDTPELVEPSKAWTLKDVGLVSNPDADGDPVEDATPTEEGELADYVDDATSLDSANHKTMIKGHIDVTDVDTGAFPGPPDVWGDWISYRLLAENGWWVSKNTLHTDYGKLTVNDRTGEYIYELDTTSEALNALAEGEWYHEQFFVDVHDTCGIKTEKPFEINIHIEGTNEAPTLAIVPKKGFEGVQEPGVIQEAGGVDGNTLFDGILKAKGKLVGSDVDNNPTLRYAIGEGDKHIFPDEQQGDSYTVATTMADGKPVGTMTLKADGSYVFEFTNPDGFNYLSKTMAVDHKVTFYVYDEHGAWDEETVTITIQGTNDKPVITEAPDLEVIDTPSGFVDSDSAKSTDVDWWDLRSYSLGQDKKDILGPDITSAKGYGKVTIDQYGKYIYTLDRTHDYVKMLPVGEEMEDSFVVYVTDEYGATDKQKVTVTIKGVNNPPQFVADSTRGTAIEDGVEVVGNAANGVHTDIVDKGEVSGMLMAEDVDTDDEAHLKYSFINIDGAYTFTDDNKAKTQTITTENGTLVLYTKTGAYTYTLDQDVVEELLPSDSIQELFTVQVKDPSAVVNGVEYGGLTDTTTLLVTIEGTNDKPFIKVNKSDVAVEVDEEGRDADTDDEALSGQIMAGDVDHKKADLSYSLLQRGEGEDPNRILQTMQGQYGHIVMNQATGEYRYFLDSDSETVQSLNDKGEFQTLTETFTVRVVDDLKAHSDVDLNITINGVNDIPTVTAATSVVYEDDGEMVYAHEGGESVVPDPVVQGQIVASDIDKGDTPTFSLASGLVTGRPAIGGIKPVIVDGKEQIKGKYGTLLLDSDDSYTYTLTGNTYVPNYSIAKVIQELNKGDMLNDVFTVYMTSGGIEQETSITIQVQGTNDAPEITGGALGEVNENEVSYSGLFEDYSDIDDGHTLSLGFMAKYDAAKGTYVAAVDAEGNVEDRAIFLSSIRGLYGTLEIDNDGNYTYTVDRYNSAVNNLKPAGETLTGESDRITDIFDLTVMDEHGATDTDKVGITITGAGEYYSVGTEPNIVKIVDVEAGTVTENGDDIKVDGETPQPSSTTTGVITLEKSGDGDYTNFATPYLEGGSASLVDEYGTLTISMDDALGTASAGNASYTYTLHEGVPFVEALAGGESFTREYDVYTEQGAYSDKAGYTEGSGTISITFVGTNDAPTFEQDTYTKLMKESDKGQMISGQVVAHDVDRYQDGTQDTLTYSFADGTLKKTTAYGTMEITDSTTGTYTYTLNNVFPDLLAGSDHIETFEIVVSDGHPLAVGEPSVKATVSVTIEAENTKPVVTLDELTVTEDDATADGHVEARGSSAVIDFDVKGALTYAISDANGNSSATVVYGTYGSLILDKATGDYRYVLDTMSEAVQTLGKGESRPDTFRYTVTDGYEGGVTETELVVNILGANDAPVLTVNARNLFVHEPKEGETSESSGQATIDDVDVNDTEHMYRLRFVDDKNVETFITGSSDDTTNFITTAYGTVRLTESGQYTYTVDPDLAAPLSQGETAVEHVTLLVQEVWTDGEGAQTFGDPVEQDITITLTGTNTAPEFSLSDVAISDARDEDTDKLMEGLTETGDGLSYVFTGKVSGDGNVTDVDSDAEDLRYSINETTQVQELSGDYGRLELDSVTGDYTYTVNKAMVTALGEEDTEGLSDTFTIDVRDEYGASDQQEITLTITGVNDDPMFSSSMPTEVEINTETLLATGRLAASDVDDKDSLTFSLVEDDEFGQDLLPEYGTVVVDSDGNYTYRLNPLESEDPLVPDVTLPDDASDSFTVQVSDGHGGIDTAMITVDLSSLADDVGVQGAMAQVYAHAQ